MVLRWGSSPSVALLLGGTQKCIPECISDLIFAYKFLCWSWYENDCLIHTCFMRFRLATGFAWWCSPCCPRGPSSPTSLHITYMDIMSIFNGLHAFIRDTKGARGNEAYDMLFYAVVAAVSYCHRRPPPGHLCDAFTLTTTLALVGTATIATGGGLDHHIAVVSAINSQGRPPL